MSWKNKDKLGTWEGNAAEAIAENLLGSIDASGTVVLANAVVGTAIRADGFAAMRAYAIGEKVALVRTGKMAGVVDDAAAVLVKGSTYFVSETVAGGITATKPSTVGDLVQKVGVACSTTELNISIGTEHVLASNVIGLQ